MENELFYDHLPIHTESVGTLLGRSEHFVRVPSDWFLVITDIKNSTKAVDGGLSEIVNLIATGGIVAALNIASDAQIDIPFFFGGDGATLILPPMMLEKTMAALEVHRANVRNEFDIDLRLGSFPVADIYRQGLELKIAKVRVNTLFSIPLVLGNGIQFAERHIKTNYQSIDFRPNDPVPLRLEGMECRWNKVPPPPHSDEVICLLLNATNESDQATVFKAVLDQIESIYGSHQQRNPISIPRLRLNTRLRKIRTELRTRKPDHSFLELMRAWMLTLIGKLWYFSKRSGQRYLADLVQLSDIFVLDGRINMVISGASENRKALIDFLEGEERQGKLLFGIHVSGESIISCYVRNRKANHIHFVDGGSGGYTQAATMLKQKMKKYREGSLQSE